MFHVRIKHFIIELHNNLHTNSSLNIQSQPLWRSSRRKISLHSIWPWVAMLVQASVLCDIALLMNYSALPQHYMDILSNCHLHERVSTPLHRLSRNAAQPPCTSFYTLWSDLNPLFIRHASGFKSMSLQTLAMAHWLCRHTFILVTRVLRGLTALEPLLNPVLPGSHCHSFM